MTKYIFDGKPAAGYWNNINILSPEPGGSYLIFANYGGIRTYDVAFYEGRRPGGEHWWILADVSIDHHSIIAWAEIDHIEEVDDA